MATKAKAKDYKDVPVEKLKARIKEAKEDRVIYEESWDKALKYYNSRPWEGTTKLAWFQSEPDYNKIFEFIENMRGYLSDNKWGVDAVPATTPEGVTQKALIDMSVKVNKLLDYLWIDSRMQNKLAQVLQYVFLYGTGFLKVTFDPDNVGDGGIGQIETTVLSPRYIFPDPDASDVHDAAFIFEHHPVSYRWVMERYPEKAAELLDSGETSSSQYKEGKAGQSAGGAGGETKRVDIWECWYNDATLMEDDGEEPKPAYPNGRRTLMTEGGIILEDGECLYSMWPYVRFIEIPRPAEFFGDCTVHKAFGIQDTINQILRAIIDNGLWMVHGIWIADTTSGVTPDTLAGYAPRDVVMKHPGSDVHRDSGVPLPPHLFDMLNQQVEAFDRVVGLPDVLRGIVPSRQPVQTVMLQQESGEVRTRERQRRVEESLADLGQLWVDIVSNHWNDKRVIRNKKALGGFDMFQLSKDDFEDWKFDILVVPGSTTPLDKNSTMTLLREMRVDVGIPIPDEVFIRNSGVPELEASMLEQAQNEGEDAPFQEDGYEDPNAPAEEGDLSTLPEMAGALPPEMGAEGMPPLPPEMGAVPPGIPPELAGMLPPRV